MALRRVLLTQSGGDDAHILLLVPWIKPDLQNAKPMKCPKHQPWLAGVLAGILSREALDEIPDEELHVAILVEDWRLGFIGNVLDENGLCFCLRLGSGCGVVICWSDPNCRGHDKCLQLEGNA